jgi:hypothetical protein
MKMMVVATKTKCAACGSYREFGPERYEILTEDKDANMLLVARKALEGFSTNRILSMHCCDISGRNWGQYQFTGIKIYGEVDE